MVLSNLAKLYSHTDHPELHRAAAEAAIAIFEPLVRTHAGNPEYTLYLADSLSELGESYRRLAQPELARTTLEKALSSSEELRDPIPQMATINIWSQISPTVWHRSTSTSGKSPS